MTDTRYALVDDAGDVRFSGFIEPAPGGSSSAVFSLTAAQIKDSTLTPHSILAAQGVGMLIVPTAWAFLYTPGGTPFSANDVDLVYGDVDLNVIYVGLGSSPIVWYAFGTQSAGISESGAPTDMLNKAIKLRANLRGAISAFSIVNAGVGYALGDTGTIDDGSPDADYTVTGVNGDSVASLSLAGGDSYTLGAGGAATEWTTTPGGSQPGGGTALTIQVTEIDASGSDGDGTLSGIVYYEIADLT
jgi:hypothetical protein